MHTLFLGVNQSLYCATVTVLWLINLVGSTIHHLTCNACLASWKGPEVGSQCAIDKSVKPDKHCTRKTVVWCLCGFLKAINWKMSWIVTVSKKIKRVVILVITCWCTAQHPSLLHCCTTDKAATGYTGFYRVCITLLPASITVRLTGMHQIVSSCCLRSMFSRALRWCFPIPPFFSHEYWK